MHKHLSLALVILSTLAVGLPACVSPDDDLITELDEATQWEGQVYVDHLRIPADVTVTAVDDLELFVEDAEIAGRLVAAPGVDITIHATAEVWIAGSVEAGVGLGPDPELRDFESVTANPGGAGGDVSIYAGGSVLVTGLLAAGDAADGGAAQLELLEDYGDALVVGGEGGRGGSVRVDAPELIVDGELHIGNGGEGGQAVVTELGVVGDSRGAVSGAGGESGDLLLGETLTVGLTLPVQERDGIFFAAIDLDHVSGGYAGLSGAAEALVEAEAEGAESSVPVSDACWNPAGKDGTDAVAKRPDGVSGYFLPDQGSVARAQGGQGKGTGAGGDATATGGKGGDVKPWVPLKIKIGKVAVSVTVGAPEATGGRGGGALAHAGAPGPVGGEGGDATATAGQGGGAAGWSTWLDFAIAGSSGRGGNAEAHPTSGADGTSCCKVPAPGQAAGDAGHGVAIGGDGGNGGAYGGDAGCAFVIAAVGGRGGDGMPAGLGGVAGQASSTPGKPGSGLAAGGTPQCKASTASAAGNDGDPCPGGQACSTNLDCSGDEVCALVATPSSQFTCIDCGELACAVGADALVFGYTTWDFESSNMCQDAASELPVELMDAGQHDVWNSAEALCDGPVAGIIAYDDGAFYPTCGAGENGGGATLMLDTVGYAVCG